MPNPPPFWATRCHVCGTARPCDLDTVARYIQSHFPKCCGVVVTLEFLANRGILGDSRETTPPPTPAIR